MISVNVGQDTSLKLKVSRGGLSVLNVGRNQHGKQGSQKRKLP